MILSGEQFLFLYSVAAATLGTEGVIGGYDRETRLNVISAITNQQSQVLMGEMKLQSAIPPPAPDRERLAAALPKIEMLRQGLDLRKDPEQSDPRSPAPGAGQTEP